MDEEDLDLDLDLDLDPDLMVADILVVLSNLGFDLELDRYSDSDAGRDSGLECVFG